MDVRRSVEDPRFDAEANILGLLNLLEAARAGGCQEGRLQLHRRGHLRRAGRLPGARDPPHAAGVALRRLQGLGRAVPRLLQGPVRAELRGAAVRQRLRPPAEPARRGRRGGHLLPAPARRPARAPSTARASRRATSSTGRTWRAPTCWRSRRTTSGAINIGTGVETDINRLYSLLAEAAGVEQARPPRPRQAGRAAALLHRQRPGAPGARLGAHRGAPRGTAPHGGVLPRAHRPLGLLITPRGRGGVPASIRLHAGRADAWILVGFGVTQAGFDVARGPLHHAGRQRPHPQLLDHRPHRPWEVHPGRSPARDDRHADQARGAGPVPRQHGARARARHHHQGPVRADELHGQRRPEVRAQPHRHPGTRGLRLRGEPLARRVRGRAAGGGRHPGRRGPDARQRLHGAGSRPGDHPGHQQDRPAERRRGAHAPGDRGRDRHRRLRRRAGLRQGGHRHRGDPRGGGEERAAAHGGSGGAAQGPHLRQLVRQLPRRGDAGARARGHAQAQAEDQAVEQQQGLRGAGAGRLQPVLPPGAAADRRRGGRAGGQREGARRTPRWATPSPRSCVPRTRPSRASRK